MNDVNVRSFVIGATNMLFRQKRHLTDVIVDVSLYFFNISILFLFFRWMVVNI